VVLFSLENGLSPDTLRRTAVRGYIAAVIGTSEVVTNRIRLGVIGITLLQSLSLSQCIFIHGQLALSVKN